MSLAQFSIIVAIDKSNGIAKNGSIPWQSRADMKFFRDTTMGRGKNVVIMGRITYESIPEEYRPLEKRHCIVISRRWKQADHPEIGVCSSLIEALELIGGNFKNYDDIFVVGGEQIYAAALRDFRYLCKQIYVTKFKMEYDCDQFFPWDLISEWPLAKNSEKCREFTRYFFQGSHTHSEYEYMNLLKDVLENGENKPDRTRTGTKSIFGAQLKFDISERLPVMTTRKISFDIGAKELLFFISGKTNTKILEEQGVKIWKGNTTREFLDSRGLNYEEGDMGAGYSFQWRHYGAEYDGADKNYIGEGIDQLSGLIKGIRDNPHSRRHILISWNPAALKKTSLPPCHVLAQFNVSGDRKYIDCSLYQRSADLFLGAPYNIMSYSLLTYMIGHVTGLKPRNFVYSIGDAHIYSNHIRQTEKLLKRMPRPFPILKFRRSAKIKEIDDFSIDSFILEGYTSWDHISAEMAI